MEEEWRTGKGSKTFLTCTLFCGHAVSDYDVL
jgi:hypothetical protein